MRAPGLNADRPRERVLLAGEGRSDRLRVNRRDVIGFGERVGDYLPVGVKVRDVKDRLFGINIGYSAIALAEVAVKFGKAYFQLGRAASRERECQHGLIKVVAVS